MWHQFGSWARFATGVWSPSANARRVLGREAHTLNTQHFGGFISQTWKSQMDDVFLCGKGQKYRDLNWSEVYPWLFVHFAENDKVSIVLWQWQWQWCEEQEKYILQGENTLCASQWGREWEWEWGRSTEHILDKAGQQLVAFLSLLAMRALHYCPCHLSIMEPGAGEIQRAYIGQKCTQLLVDNVSFFGHRSYHVFSLPCILSSRHLS